MSKKIYQAIGLTFGLSWGLALVAKLCGVVFSGNMGFALAIVYMFMPALSVFILSKFVWKVKVSEWGIRWPKSKLFFVAWPIFIVIAAACIPVALMMPGVSYSPGMEGIIAKYMQVMPPEQVAQVQQQITGFGPWLILIIIFQSLVAGITVNAIAGFGEELMWRGFLVKELKKWGWIKMSVIIGFIWGLWHAPLIIQGHNYPQHPYIGVLMMIVWCILLTPYLIYFTLRTRSVITAAVMHGTLNASAGLGILWLVGGNDLLVGITGLAGFITLFIFDLGLIIYDKKSKIKADELLKDY